MPRAPLPSEAAAESFGHTAPFVLQARQAAHSGLSKAATLLHTPAGQHAPHVLPPEAEAEAEIRPSLAIDIPGIMAPQAVTAASSGMQVPSEPLQYSQSPHLMPLRLRAAQLSEVQVASIVTVSPTQPLHVHVDSLPEPLTALARHGGGGHSFVAAQQPLLPGLEPSAHVPAEAQTAAKTSTSAMSLPPPDMVVLLYQQFRCASLLQDRVGV